MNVGGVENRFQKDMLVVSGFGWSGSGAVVDFLRENSFVRTAGGDEIIFFWALKNLIDKITGNKHLDPGKGEFEALFCARVPDWYSREKREQYETTFDSYFAETEASRQDYSDSAYRILEQMDEDVTAFSVEIAASNAATAVLKLLSEMYSSESTFYIYDNLFHPQQLALLEHADLSRFSTFQVYCVDRDPRDQFYEHYDRYKSGLGLWHQMNGRQKLLKTLSSRPLFQWLLGLLPFQLAAARLFCRMHTAKRSAFEQSLSRLSELQPHMVVKKIKFEDFVTDAGEQRSLVKRDIDNIIMSRHGTSHWEHGMFFDPSFSEKNIAKYRGAPHQLVYKTILKHTRKGR